MTSNRTDFCGNVCNRAAHNNIVMELRVSTLWLCLGCQTSQLHFFSILLRMTLIAFYISTSRFSSPIQTKSCMNDRCFADYLFCISLDVSQLLGVQNGPKLLPIFPSPGQSFQCQRPKVTFHFPLYPCICHKALLTLSLELFPVTQCC